MWELEDDPIEGGGGDAIGEGEDAGSGEVESISEDDVFGVEFDLSAPDVSEALTGLNPRIGGMIQEMINDRFGVLKDQVTDWSGRAHTFIRQSTETVQADLNELGQLRTLFQQAKEAGDSVAMTEISNRFNAMKSEYETYKETTGSALEAAQNELAAIKQAAENERIDAFFAQHPAVFDGGENEAKWAALCDDGFRVDIAAALTIMPAETVDKAKGIAHLGWSGDSLLGMVDMSPQLIAKATMFRRQLSERGLKDPDDIALALAKQQIQGGDLTDEVGEAPGNNGGPKVRYMRRRSSAARNLSKTTHRRRTTTAGPVDPNDTNVPEREAITIALDRINRNG